MQTLPFAEARAQLAEALRSVEAGDEPVLISRRGRAAGVLMSCRQYHQLTGEPGGFVERIGRWRAEHLAQAQGSGADDPFAGVRQTEPARDFSW